MALSENLKKLHAEQDAFAAEHFEKYKETIAREFIDKFGGSYQRYEEIGDNWRKFYQYGQECEKFVKERTVVFLGTLPEHNGICRNPRFLKNLIAKISEYLSLYVAKKFGDPYKERNHCTADLIEYFNKHHVFKNIMETFQRGKEREWGLRQKALRKQKEAAKEQKKRKRIHKQHVEHQQEQLAKLNEKSIRERIRLKKLEIASFQIYVRNVNIKG